MAVFWCYKPEDSHLSSNCNLELGSSGERGNEAYGSIKDGDFLD
jgi:hypothetical protein